jgi:L-alanine-DL-glutamate epimerase-like enolase superfamily enzyme
VPIATGENTYLVDGFRALIDARAVSIVTPDAQKCGGLAETKRIFDDAALAFLQGAPHCIASPLGLVAAAHASAAATNVLSIEFHGADVPFWADLIDSTVIEAGEVIVPSGPGLGVELNEEVVRAYGRRGEPVFGQAPSQVRKSRAQTSP